MIKNNKNYWYTLIEILVSIVIISIVLIIWFQAYSFIMLWKSKIIETSNIEKEIFFFTQRLFEEIKQWWFIDYEEYFNRKIVWNTDYLSGHYSKQTWFWNYGSWWDLSNNYWSWYYLCRSWSWSYMWTWWCINSDHNTSNSTIFWSYQRYWQYSFHFINYNSNADNDLWNEDENLDLNIIWDDDDEYLGSWPEVFSSWTWVSELYMVSWDKKIRTFFRLYVDEDPNRPDWSSCNFSDKKNPTWSWCIWTIQYIKLNWADLWMNHSWSITSSWLYDWVIDTWFVDNRFAWDDNIIAWSWSDVFNDSMRLSLFSDSINITKFEVFVYPNKDSKLAWNEELSSSPYIRLKLKLSPSRKIKKIIKWVIPEFDIITTINLTDIFSN